jgi:hypothetical protein
MHGCTNRKAKSRRMDGHSISIMNVHEKDKEGSLDFGVGIG